MAVFAEGDIQMPVQRVFDGSMPAHEAIGLRSRQRPAAQVVALLYHRYGGPGRGLHSPQRAQLRPAPVFVHPAQLATGPDRVVDRGAVGGKGPARSRLFRRQRRSTWERAASRRWNTRLIVSAEGAIGQGQVAA